MFQHKILKVALENRTKYTQKKPRIGQTGQTEPGLVAFYDIRPQETGAVRSRQAAVLQEISAGVSAVPAKALH